MIKIHTFALRSSVIICAALLGSCNWMDSNYWEMEQQTERGRLVVEQLDMTNSNLLPEIREKYQGKKTFHAYMRTDDAAKIHAPNSQEFQELLSKELKLRGLCHDGYTDIHVSYNRTFNTYWGVCK